MALDEDVIYTNLARRTERVHSPPDQRNANSSLRHSGSGATRSRFSGEHTFKEEHYCRIAYANEHFASGVPGWKTDRGPNCIAWGPPDERDEHTGEQYDRPLDQGGGTTTTYAYETWRYRYAEGLGENFEMEFVDPTGTGGISPDHVDPSEKDALLNVPGAGLTLPEEEGLADKSSRFSNARWYPPRGTG